MAVLAGVSAVPPPPAAASALGLLQDRTKILLTFLVVMGEVEDCYSSS